MSGYLIFGVALLCLLNIAVHAGVPRRNAPAMDAIMLRWLPAAVGTGAVAAITLGGLAFLLSLAAD